MRLPETPPAVCIIGKKNSGKTTLTVALAAELKRRGRRVATIKHGHHDFESDEKGRDSWRHFNEGEAEATIMAGTGKIALTMRVDGEPDPEALVRAFYTGRGYDVVLIEGFKYGALPKIEVFRHEKHDRAIYDEVDEEASRLFEAIVTDDPDVRADCVIIVMDRDEEHGDHVREVADLVERRFLRLGWDDDRRENGRG